jgi:hypothetical protein
MTKEQELLFDYLLVYWQKLIDGFRLELERAYPLSSGITAATIDEGNPTPISITSNGYKVTIVMPPHYQFLDEGVSGAKNNTGRSRFSFKDKGKGDNGRGQKGIPPITVIRKFMLNRGINSWSDIKSKNSGNTYENTKSGKEQTAEEIRQSIAYVIAYSIWRDGTEGSKFYTNVINDKSILAFENKLKARFAKYVIDVVKVAKFDQLKIN